ANVAPCQASYAAVEPALRTHTWMAWSPTSETLGAQGYDDDVEKPRASCQPSASRRQNWYSSGATPPSTPVAHVIDVPAGAGSVGVAVSDVIVTGVGAVIVIDMPVYPSYASCDPMLRTHTW